MGAPRILRVRYFEEARLHLSEVEQDDVLIAKERIERGMAKQRHAAGSILDRVSVRPGRKRPSCIRVRRDA